MRKGLTGLVLLILIGLIVFYVTEKPDGEPEPVREDAQETAAPSAPGVKIGSAAPDFTLKTVIGDTVTLSSLKGKKVLLNFWATWCPPCQEEMPALENIYKKYKGEGIEIIAVNATVGKETEEKVKQFIDVHQLTFPVPLDTDGEVVQMYGIYGMPTSYFIDENGVVRSFYFGMMTEEMIIRELKKL